MHLYLGSALLPGATHWTSLSPHRLLEELLNTFKSTMHLQLACFQTAGATLTKT